MPFYRTNESSSTSYTAMKLHLDLLPTYSLAISLSRLMFEGPVDALKFIQAAIDPEKLDERVFVGGHRTFRRQGWRHYLYKRCRSTKNNRCFYTFYYSGKWYEINSGFVAKVG